MLSGYTSTKSRILAITSYCQECVNRHPRLTGNILLCICSAIILSCFTPQWQTSDDPTFAMHIGGYGMAATPAYYNEYIHYFLTFAIQHIPDFFDIHAYTLTLLFLNLASLFTIYNILAAYKVHFACKLALAVTMLFYCLLLMQYTVSAFYCAIAASLCFLYAVQNGKKHGLVISFLFACLAFMLRQPTIFAIALFGIFLYPYKKLLKPEYLLFCVMVIVAFFLLHKFNNTYLIQNAAHESHAWNSDRIKLTDHQWARFFQNNPVSSPELSTNDLELLHRHFSADKPLRDKGVELIKTASPFNLAYLNFKISYLKESLAMFLDFPLDFFVLIIFLLAAQKNSPRIWLTLLLYIVVFALVGLFQRSGIWVSRIYFAPIFYFLCLLLLMPLPKASNTWFYIKPFPATCITVFLLILPIFSFTTTSMIQNWQAQKLNPVISKEALNGALLGINLQPVLELLYPPFSSASGDKNTVFQSMFITALLPNGVKYFDPLEETGFREYFINGFNMACSPDQLNLMANFCREHLDGSASWERISPENAIPVFHIQCQPFKN